MIACIVLHLMHFARIYNDSNRYMILNSLFFFPLNTDIHSIHTNCYTTFITSKAARFIVFVQQFSWIICWPSSAMLNSVNCGKSPLVTRKNASDLLIKFSLNFQVKWSALQMQFFKSCNQPHCRLRPSQSSLNIYGWIHCKYTIIYSSELLHAKKNT